MRKGRGGDGGGGGGGVCGENMRERERRTCEALHGYGSGQPLCTADRESSKVTGYE